MSYQQEVFNVISSFTGHNANYVVPKEFMRLLKDSNSALILSQLVYWTGRQTDPNGWIYKSYKEWDEEIFLSQKAIMTAVKKLKKLGVLDTAVRKIRLPSGMLTNQTCVHYRIDQDKLAELVTKQLESLGNAEREFPGTSEREFPKNAEREFPSINTNITNKDYDNIQGEPSSSFSENDFIKTVAALMTLVPEQYNKPTVEKTVEKGLRAHTEDYIRLAILYTVSHSNGGTWQKFKAFLGKCIDNGWADGWGPGLDQVDDEKKKETFLESRRHMPDDILKSDAEKGCKISAQVLSERGVKYQGV